MSPTYNDPKHPEHKDWLAKRRERFVSLIREGKRACKLLPEEREAVVQLARMIEKNTKELCKK